MTSKTKTEDEVAKHEQLMTKMEETRKKWLEEDDEQDDTDRLLM